MSRKAPRVETNPVMIDCPLCASKETFVSSSPLGKVAGISEDHVGLFVGLCDSCLGEWVQTQQGEVREKFYRNGKVVDRAGQAVFECPRCHKTDDESVTFCSKCGLSRKDL